MEPQAFTEVDFKFRDEASPADREDVLESLRSLGVTRVEQLFPDELEIDLADLWVVVLPGDIRENGLQVLADREAVEFAEARATRQLIW